jgi:hypothetical protein
MARDDDATLRALTERTAYEVEPDVWRGMVEQAVEVQGRDWTLNRLREKARDTRTFEGRVERGYSPIPESGDTDGNSEAARGTKGWGRYWDEYMGQLGYLPAPLFWYHGDLVTP